MTTFFRLLDSAADATAAQGGWLSTLLTFLPFVLLIVVFYFMLIRPQKKQQRELDAMRSSIAKGDIVTTKGGIVGIVVNHKTKEVIGGPDVQSRGVIYLKDADHIVKEIGNIIERTVEDAVKEKRYENMAVRMEAKDRIVKYVLKETGKRPMILPAIVEINVTE